MRKLIVGAATVAALYAAARWWRQHPRTGAAFVNRTINPWLERRGVIGRSGGELAIVEHVGRQSGVVRRTPVHPVPTPGGIRIIVPIGEQSQWVRNVLAAGHCRLLIGDRVLELDEPVLESPAEVPGLSRPVRALFDWLGFRYLRLRTFSEAQPDAVVPTREAAPSQPEAVPVGH